MFMNDPRLTFHVEPHVYAWDGETQDSVTAILKGGGLKADGAEFYTDDAIYIDPAWGRVEGLDAIREFMIESMLGLEDWLFPVEFTAV